MKSLDLINTKIGPSEAVYTTFPLKTEEEKNAVEEAKNKIEIAKKQGNSSLKSYILEELKLKYSTLEDFACREMSLQTENVSNNIKYLKEDKTWVEEFKAKIEKINDSCSDFDVLLMETIAFLSVKKENKRLLVRYLFYTASKVEEQGQANWSFATQQLAAELFLEVETHFESDPTALNLLVKLAICFRSDYLNLILVSILKKHGLSLKANCICPLESIKQYLDVKHFVFTSAGLFIATSSCLIGPKKEESFDSSEHHTVFLEDTGSSLRVYLLSTGKTEVKVQEWDYHLNLTPNQPKTMKFDQNITKIAYSEAELAVESGNEILNIVGNPSLTEIKKVFTYFGSSRVKNAVFKDSILKVMSEVPGINSDFFEIEAKFEGKHEFNYGKREIEAFVVPENEGIDCLSLVLKSLIDCISHRIQVDELFINAVFNIADKCTEIQRKHLLTVTRVYCQLNIDPECKTLLKDKLKKLDTPEAREILHVCLNVESDLSHLTTEDKLERQYPLNAKELLECSSTSIFMLQQVCLNQEKSILLKESKIDAVKALAVCSLNDCSLEELIQIYKQNVTTPTDFKEIGVVSIGSVGSKEFDIGQSAEFLVASSLSNKPKLGNQLKDNPEIFKQTAKGFKMCLKCEENEQLSFILTEKPFEISIEQFVEFGLLLKMFSKFEGELYENDFSEEVNKIVQTRLLRAVEGNKSETKVDFDGINKQFELKEFLLGDKEKTRRIVRIVNILFLTAVKHQNLLSCLLKQEKKELFREIFKKFEGLRQWIFLRKGMFISESSEETAKKVEEDLKMLENRAEFLFNLIQPEDVKDPSFEDLKPVVFEVLLVFKTTSVTVSQIEEAIQTNNKRVDSVIKLINAITEVLENSQDSTHMAFLLVNKVKRGVDFSFHRCVGALDWKKSEEVKKASVAFTDCVFKRIFNSNRIKEQIALIYCLFGSYSTTELIHFAKQDYYDRLLELVKEPLEEEQSTFVVKSDKFALKQVILDFIRSILVQLVEKTEKKQTTQEFALAKKVSLLTLKETSTVAAFAEELASKEVLLGETLIGLEFTFENELQLIEEVKTEENLLKRIKLASQLIYSLKVNKSATQLKDSLKELVNSTCLPFTQYSEISSLIGETTRMSLVYGDNVIGNSQLEQFACYKENNKIVDYPTETVKFISETELNSNSLVFSSLAEAKAEDFEDSLPFEMFFKELAGLKEWNLYSQGNRVFLLNTDGFVEINPEKNLPQGWDKGKLTRDKDNVIFEGKHRYVFSTETTEETIKTKGLNQLKLYCPCEKTPNLEERVNKSLALRAALRSRTGDFAKTLSLALSEAKKLSEKDIILMQQIVKYMEHRQIQEIIPYLDDIPYMNMARIVDTADYSKLDETSKIYMLCENISSQPSTNRFRIAEKLLSLAKNTAEGHEVVFATAKELENSGNFNNLVFSFMNYVREVSIKVNSQDFAFTNQELKDKMQENDLLMLEFTKSSLEKLRNTFLTETGAQIKTEEKVVSHGINDTNILALEEITVPEKGCCLSVQHLKMNEVVLVFADKEGSKLIDFFSYYDKDKELVLKGEKAYISLPYTNFTTKIAKGKKIIEALSDRKIYKMHSDQSNAFFQDENSFFANYKMLEGDAKKKFKAESAESINKLGNLKHFSSNQGNIALITAENKFYCYNSIEFDDRSDSESNQLDLDGPIDTSELGEVTSLFVLSYNVVLGNAEGELYILGNEMGTLMKNESNNSFVKVKTFPGRIVSLGGYSVEEPDYDSYEEDNLEETDALLVLVDDGKRTLYSMMTDPQSIFPCATRELKETNMEVNFSSIAINDSATFIHDLKGKLHIYGKLRSSSYPLKNKVYNKPALIESEEIIDHAADIQMEDEDGDEENTLVTVSRKPGGIKKVVKYNKNKAKEFKIEGLLPLRLCPVADKLYTIGTDFKAKYEVEPITPGDNKFTYYLRSEQLSVDYTPLYAVTKNKMKSLLSLYANNLTLPAEKVKEIIDLNQFEINILKNFFAAKVNLFKRKVNQEEPFSKIEQANLQLLGNKASEEILANFITVLEKSDSFTNVFTVDRKSAVEFLATESPDTEMNKTMFNQLFKNQHKFNYRDKIFELKLKGEGATDCGGPTREVFTLIGKELMSSALDLLVPSPNKLGNYGDFRETFVINPTPSETTVERLRFLGKLMAHCLLTESAIQLELNPIVWKSICNSALTREDIKLVDNYFYDILATFEKEDLTEETIDACTEGKFKVTTLGSQEKIIKEAELTLQNVKEYVEEAKNFKLKEIKEQAKFILEGVE